jgi:hypothetical protein
MDKINREGYVYWAGLVFVLVLGTFVRVILHSFGPVRSPPSELVVDYVILASAVGLGWWLVPGGRDPLHATRPIRLVVMWLFGAVVLAAAIVITVSDVPEALILYFAIPLLRQSHPSNSPGPPTPAEWRRLAIAACGVVLLSALYVWSGSIVEAAIHWLSCRW